MKHRACAVLLTLLLLTLLIANSAVFFFHQPYYEMWDFAANSLSIGRARHFAELYGPYSRWGFHHPGPMMFYALGFGEWLFYDKLHLTPAPYNAQALAQACLSTAFYGAALAMFARRLPWRACAGWFWPLAIALGTLHFGFASRLPSYDFLRGPSAFTSTWSAHEIVLPFLCLLAAGASVAAGDGQDLPLLAVSAGTLLHLHVAQPLFVGPLTLLAYLGLVVICARRERAGAAGTNTRRWPGAAWRAFQRWHVVAGLIAGAFALPLVLDLFHGADSNLAAILHHLRTHHGERKPLVRSVLYFLQFGAYTPYAPGRFDFGRYDRAGAWAYVRWHAPLFAIWLSGLLVVLAIIARPALAAAVRRPPEAVAADPAGRGRFLAWAGWFLLAGIGLTLYWGTIQDGAMFYYNAWLNFALYYFGLLIVVAELSVRLDARPPVSWKRRLAPLAAAVLICALLAGRWRVSDAVPETTALLHESVRRVLDATRATNASRGLPALEFSEGEWPVAAALGLEMARAGRPFEVDDRWVNVFGRNHAARNWPADAGINAAPWRFKPGPRAVRWRSDAPETLAPSTRQLREELASSTAADPTFPLPDDTQLATALPVLSLSGDGQTGEINFERGGNAPDFMLAGWSAAEPWGTWSDGRRGVLRFAVGGPVEGGGGGVEMTVELHPFVSATAGLTAQRVSVRFDGQALGTEQRAVEGGPPLAWTIPAARWNEAADRPPGATLEFQFPDAASPAALDRDGRVDDTRLLGVGISRVRFRAVPAQ